LLSRSDIFKPLFKEDYDAFEQKERVRGAAGIRDDVSAVAACLVILLYAFKSMQHFQCYHQCNKGGTSLVAWCAQSSQNTAVINLVYTSDATFAAAGCHGFWSRLTSHVVRSLGHCLAT
jgi:hypothetical protein